MGFRDWLSKGVDVGKGARSTTPPMQAQKPKYTAKKQVKAVNPKKGGKK